MTIYCGNILSHLQLSPSMMPPKLKVRVQAQYNYDKKGIEKYTLITPIKKKGENFLTKVSLNPNLEDRVESGKSLNFESWTEGADMITDHCSALYQTLV